MITMNAEKGMMRVESWDDLLSRPGFVTDLNPTTKQLKEIIGRYLFKTKVRCGLSNCHTPHGKGYIVTTTDGTETNIGKDCGKTYFGVDFEVLSRRFDEQVAAFEDRQALTSFSFRIEELERRIGDLKNGPDGALWAHSKLTALSTHSDRCPRRAIDTLGQLVKSRSRTLTRAREATDAEIEELEVIERRRIDRPHYVTEQAGELGGLDALYPENDLRKVLVLGVIEQLDAFKTKDIDSMSHIHLRSWVKWVNTVEPSLERVEQILGHAKELLQRGNLMQMAAVLDDAADQRDFRKFVGQLLS